MFPVFFEVGHLTFYTHGIFAVLGIIVSTIVIHRMVRDKLDRSYLFDNMVYSVLSGIVGARVTYYLLYQGQFDSFKEILYIWQGGLVSYGGFVLGGLALAILLKMQKQPVLAWLDYFAIAFPLGLFFGRFGEFLSGEDFGILSNLPLAIRGRIPINLFEALWCLAIFGILIIARRKNRNGTEGVLVPLSVLLYTLGRFLIDFGRDESRLYFNLSLGQFVSLMFFAVSFVFLLIFALKKRGNYGA